VNQPPLTVHNLHQPSTHTRRQPLTEPHRSFQPFKPSFCLPAGWAGITTERCNIPSIKKHNEMGREELVLKRGHRHLVIDVAINHEFGGDHLADVSRNGALRDVQPGRILESTARTKVDRHRDGYAAIKYAFLPCVISTSGASTASSCASSTLHHCPPPHLQLVQAA
jgi:hypothetical protein